MNYYCYENFISLNISGAGAKDFLQGQLTLDMNDLINTYESRSTSLCSQKGRVLLFSYICKSSENNYIIMVEKSISEFITAHFKKYSLFSKVSFEYNDDFILVFESGNHKIIKKTESTISNISSKDMGIIDMKNKFTIINSGNYEKFLPADLNLELFNAISYSKGCFMGQEIIARMKYKSNSKKHLSYVIFSSKIDISESKLIDQDNKTIATIVNFIVYDSKIHALILFNKKPDSDSILISNNINIELY